MKSFHGNGYIVNNLYALDKSESLLTCIFLLNILIFIVHKLKIMKHKNTPRIMTFVVIDINWYQNMIEEKRVKVKSFVGGKYGCPTKLESISLDFYLIMLMLCCNDGGHTSSLFLCLWRTNLQLPTISQSFYVWSRQCLTKPTFSSLIGQFICPI